MISVYSNKQVFTEFLGTQRNENRVVRKTGVFPTLTRHTV